MITTDVAKTAVNQTGLNALGLASGMLTKQWAASLPAYDQGTLTLNSSSNWKAMTGGVFLWHIDGAPNLYDVTGTPLSGATGVLAFHPQAALRIRRLIGNRYDGVSDGSAKRPTPFFAAIRNGTVPTSTAPAQANVGDDLVEGDLSFHDEKGMIIDPMAVASLFDDLISAFSALSHSGTGITLNAITGLITSEVRKFQITDPYGNPWVDIAGRPGLRIGAGSRLDSGIHTWTEGQSISSTSSSSSSLKWGLYPIGTLGTSNISPPSFPGTVFPAESSTPQLRVQFFRIIAVDLELHLTGNRSDTAIDGVEAADAKTVLEPSPTIINGDTASFLKDGQTMNGAVAEIAGLTGFRMAVSPIIQTDHSIPPNRLLRWPSFPVTTETAQSLTAEIATAVRSDITATYVGSGPDIIISWPAGSLPSEAHVRVFPRIDPGPALIPLAELDFARRGEGGSGIAKASGLTILLKDPYRIGSGLPPTDPELRFDLLIVTRETTVQGRLFGGLKVQVGVGGTAPVVPSSANPVDGIPNNQRGISPAPILGIRPTAPASGSNPLLSALGEAEPRESPRFRTMSRNSSLVAAHDGGAPGTWTALNTSGILDSRSLRDDADLGNPGNPSGPEDHAPGLFLTGQLAQTHARAALRRTHHFVRRLPELDEERWNDFPAGTGSIAGTTLQNIAPTVESPELDLVPDSIAEALPSDWIGLINAIQGFLPPSFAPLIGAIPAPGAGDRWVAETRRELLAAKNGRRDSLWSWRWAIAHARKLIYIETSLFSSSGDGTEDHKVDLLNELQNRLIEMPGLHVILSLPKRIPFGPGYESFAQYFYQERKRIISNLQVSAPGRVVAFHPIGFPGRPEVIRGTVAIIDDVWALIGSSTFSRRGLTFDGSTDTVFIDKTISNGSSHAISNLRKETMARILAINSPAAGETSNANFVQLTNPLSSFKVFKQIVERGGDGLVEPLWEGLSEDDLPSLDKSIADPEGRDFSSVIGGFAAILSDLGADRT